MRLLLEELSLTKDWSLHLAEISPTRPTDQKLRNKPFRILIQKDDIGVDILLMKRD
jgi:16S rRNA G966 N2-methylase RsmD